MYVCIGLRRRREEAIAVLPQHQEVRQPFRAIASPSWHRKLRLKRAKARASVRLGLPVSRLQRDLLSRHHGTDPHFRALLRGFPVRMGRGSKQGSQQGGQQWRQGEHGYRVWPGAYSPQQPQARDKRPWRSDVSRPTTSFPSYASVSLPVEKTAPTRNPSERSGGRAGNTSATPAIQTALNHTRKAEGKVNRLRDALQESGLLWQEYEAQMKEAFRKERVRFAKDRERLEKEILEAEEAQELARQGLRDAFFGAQRSTGSADVSMLEGPDADQVFEQWTREDEGAADGVLQRALAPRDHTPNRATATAPRTPPGGAPPAPVIPLMSGTPTAVTDPYYNSMSPVMTPAAIQHYLQQQMMQSQISVAPPGLAPIIEAPAAVTAAVPPEVPAPGPLGEGPEEGYGKSPTLHDRVQRRRAMEPFGGGRGPAPAGAPDSLPPDARLPTNIRIVEDDDELNRADESDLS